MNRNFAQIEGEINFKLPDSYKSILNSFNRVYEIELQNNQELDIISLEKLV